MSREFKCRFSGHQTFALRHGWLEKGVELIRNNPHGFLEDDVLIRLGVGKNMVESVKYWCCQTQLLQESKKSGEMELSDMARYIFGSEDGADGADPYLEDDATLWLLHWFLMQNPVVSTWQLAFSKLNKPEFSKAELLLIVQKWLSDKNIKISEPTLLRDVDCFIRSYAGTRGKPSEETLGSPFLSLRLLHAASELDLHRFNIGAKQNLPAEIVGFAILKTMEAEKRTSLDVRDCLYEAAKPGQVFKLDEGTLLNYLDELEKTTKGKLAVTDAAGLVSVSFSASESPSQQADALLARYYHGKEAQ